MKSLTPYPSKMTQNVNSYDTIFRWSCFDDDHTFVQETEELFGSEYQNADEADTKIRIEDGEDSFDIGRSVQKKIFGLYGEFRDKWYVSAERWDKKRRDLVGCATIKDWEWENYAEDEALDDESVLERLQEEISGIFGDPDA